MGKVNDGHFGATSGNMTRAPGRNGGLRKGNTGGGKQMDKEVGGAESCALFSFLFFLEN